MTTLLGGDQGDSCATAAADSCYNAGRLSLDSSRAVLLESGGGFAIHQLTRYRWLDIVLGLAGGFLLTAALTLGFAAWYLGHLGRDSPVLWDGYGFWFGALAVSLLPVVWLRDRAPAFAGALLAGVCGSSLLLVVTLWLLDNGVGFSA